MNRRKYNSTYDSAGIINAYNPLFYSLAGVQPSDSDSLIDRRYRWDLAVPGLVAIGSGRCGRKHFSMRPQSHPGALEVYYMAKGLLDVKVDGHSLVMRGGDVLIVPPGVHHEGMALPTSKVEVFWAIFPVGIPGASILGLSSLTTDKLISAMLNSSNRSFYVGFDLAAPFSAAVFAAMSNSPWGEMSLVGGLNEILQVIMDRISAPDDVEADRHRLLGELDSLVSSMCGGDPPSAAVGMCDREFMIRNCRSITGMPFHEYLTRARIIAAKGRLRTGGEDIIRVALDLGFSSHSHFSSVFRRWTGYTPRGWRDLTVDSALPSV